MTAPLGPGSRDRIATPYELLAARSDRSRPFVTSYDGPDSSIELSVTTTMNAVAKAAGLLRDELGLVPGDRLSVDLPVHWQFPVWTLAGLTAGLVCGRGVGDRVAARIVGPAGLAELAAGADPRADEVLGCSCDAFGMPVRGGVPRGVTDVGVAVRAHPDVLQVEPDAGARAALLIPGPQTTGGWSERGRRAVARGRRPGPGRRRGRSHVGQRRGPRGGRPAAGGAAAASGGRSGAARWLGGACPRRLGSGRRASAHGAGRLARSLRPGVVPDPMRRPT